MILISQTPLRISFVGGGTDIEEFYRVQEGAVLSTAIAQFLYVILKRRKDHLIDLYHSQSESVEAPHLLEHELVRETMEMTGIKGGLDIVILSDVPAQGTGLGSSSTLTAGLLKAFYAFQGIPVGPEEIAQRACEIEIDRLGHPIGKQDQYAAAYGGMNIFRFQRDGHVKVEPVHMDKAARDAFFRQLYLVNTRISRKAADVLTEVKKSMSQNMEFLKQMAGMPDHFRASLTAGAFHEVAAALRNGWEFKKRMGSTVTNPAVDTLYHKGITAGAAAGKLLGAGAGGFMLFFVPEEKQKGFLSAMTEEHEVIPVHYAEKGSTILYGFNESLGGYV